MNGLQIKQEPESPYIGGLQIKEESNSPFMGGLHLMKESECNEPFSSCTVDIKAEQTSKLDASKDNNI